MTQAVRTSSFPGSDMCGGGLSRQDAMKSSARQHWHVSYVQRHSSRSRRKPRRVNISCGATRIQLHNGFFHIAGLREQLGSSMLLHVKCRPEERYFPLRQVCLFIVSPMMRLIMCSSKLQQCLFLLMSVHTLRQQRQHLPRQGSTLLDRHISHQNDRSLLQRSSTHTHSVLSLLQ